jgi:hypothetical protein
MPFPKLIHLSTAQIVLPRSVAEVLPLLDRARVVWVMQCDAQIAEALRRYSFRYKPFPTLLIDLGLAEEEIWKQMDRLCHRQIRKAQALGLKVLVNEEQDAAVRLINDFIARRQFRAPISADQWQSWMASSDHDVFVCKDGDTPVAARVVFTHESGRAREHLSATVDRQDPRFHNVVGPANRFLLWSALLHYKQKGLRCYDLGGLEMDEKSPCRSIAEFKLSFGGQVVQEYVLGLSSNWPLRVILGSVLAVRRAIIVKLLYPFGVRNLRELRGISLRFPKRKPEQGKSD